MTKRRDFVKGMALTAAAMVLPGMPLYAKRATKMKLGLVTYQWGKDWDVPTLIRNCEKSGLQGVELRTQHQHGVEPSLTSAQRMEVKKRFEDSRVTLVGYGSNEQFDNPDSQIVKENVERTKALLTLSHDVGGSGVKVKPNQFHEGIPQEKTIEQIGISLNEVGKFAGDLGQQIRLEVHGPGTQKLSVIKAIMDVADDPNVTVCWNSNPEDLSGNGLEHNFNLVKSRLGDTVHVHEMNTEEYPYQELMSLLEKTNYSGWILLECSSTPEDKIHAMIGQREVWESMLHG